MTKQYVWYMYSDAKGVDTSLDVDLGEREMKAN